MAIQRKSERLQNGIEIEHIRMSRQANEGFRERVRQALAEMESRAAEADSENAEGGQWHE